MKRSRFELPPALLDGCVRSPLVIADVGARGGLQSRWQCAAEHVTWIGFEPDVRSVETLPATAVPARSHILPVALSDRAGRVRFHRTRDEGDSSLLMPNRVFLDQFPASERFEVVDTVELDGDTLDAQLAGIGVDSVDVIKLDTQGTELAILRGASHALQRGVLAVDVEVEFSPLYEGQALFADVDAYLRGLGLQLMDLVPRRWPYAAGQHLDTARGQVVWAEAVYFPTIERLAADVASYQLERSRRLAKACLVALTYGLSDFALALIERCAGDVGVAGSNELRDAVLWWDAHAPEPRVPMSIEIHPDQLRALQSARTTTGLKPAKQLRLLLKQWVASRTRP